MILCVYGCGSHTDSYSVTDPSRIADPGCVTDPTPLNRARGNPRQRPGSVGRNKLVPTIIVMSNESAGRGSAVVLEENIQPEHLSSKHHAAQLIERVGWAVTDAKEAEAAGP
jgi:hypothetical protein